MAKKTLIKAAQASKTLKKNKARVGQVTWNDMIAKSRNPATWKKRIMEGKTEVQIYPTLLRQKRIQLGISQAHMAEKVNLSVTTYGDVERAKRPVKKATAILIAEGIGSVSHHLFDGFKTPKGKIAPDKMVAKKAA